MIRHLPEVKIVNKATKAVEASGILDVAFVIRYLEAGLRDDEIAALARCSSNEVMRFRKLHGLEGNNNVLSNFREMKGSVFNNVLKNVVHSLDVEKISKLEAKDYAKLIETLNKNARLESGQSTTNVAAVVFSVIQQAEEESDEKNRAHRKSIEATEVAEVVT